MQTPLHDANLTDFSLDMLGQQCRINRLYTQITYCYPLAGKDNLYSPSKIIQILEDGFRHLSTSFPWISGQIAYENGTFKITPSNGRPHIVIKDYSKDPSIPDWNTLQQANFPFSMLDESILAPCKTLEPSSKGLLIFLIQANFVRGRGLLLTFSGQHGSMDMAGLAEVMYLFSKACRNEAFTEEELAIGNMERRNVIPLLDNDPHDRLNVHNSRPAADEKVQRAQQNESHLSLNACTWAYFSFNSNKLSALKSQATATLPTGTSDFISTDDALSAFFWHSISRIRLRHYFELDEATSSLKTTLSRNVDVRHHLGIPASYPGLVTDQTVHTFPLEEVAHQSLGCLSSNLRSALDPQSLNHHTRALATHISQEKNAENGPKSVLKARPELEVRLSSWAKEKCYRFDFGIGLPVAVRRPRFTDGSRDGLVYFLPKSLEGEIVVGVCLRCGDMERLKNDEEFLRFGTFLG